jgi:hypothetical protein
MADQSRRISILGQLRKDYAEVLTPILISYLPGLQDASSATARPRFYSVAEPKISSREYEEQVTEFSYLLVEGQPDEPTLFALFDKLGDLVPAAREKILTALEALDLGTLDQEYAHRLWVKLQKLHRAHELFASAQWAWNADLCRRVAGICERLEPTDPVKRNAWLFEKAKMFLQTSLEEPMPEFEARLKDRRTQALRQIFAQFSLEEVMNQIKFFEDTSAVGEIIAEQELLDVDLTYLLQLFASEDASRFQFALGYALCLVLKQGFSEVCCRLPDGAPPRAYAGFAFACDFSPEVWDWLEERDKAVQNEYWSKVRPFKLLESEDFIERASVAFCQRGRAATAINLLVQELYSNNRLSKGLVINILNAAGQTDSNSWLEGDVLFRYNLNLLFKFLKKQGITRAELEQLELLHLPHLIASHTAEQPAALFQALQLEPEFYMNCTVWSLSGESVRPAFRSEAFRNLVDQWTLAGNLWWDRDPSFGDVKSWIQTLRTLAEAKGLLSDIDRRIGRMLAFAPPKIQSHIVPIVVSQILNVIVSPEIESGLTNGLFDRRGVYSRGLSEGGQSTRALATSFENRAAEIDVEYPRTAKILQRLAASYHSKADMEDQERLL